MRRCAFLALLGLAAPAFPEDLSRAKQLLAAPGEKDVRLGADACANANSPEAVELLLDVLERDLGPARPHLASAHYRDIAWEGLERISAPAARDRVEKELRTNRKNAFVRQWCAELLGIYGDERFGPTLTKALADSHEGVRRWAARSLGLLRHAPAAPALERLLKDEDPMVRANAHEALAWIDPAASKERYLEALRQDPDGGVRCALLGAVPGLYREASRDLAAAALKDADWRPRMQAVDNLALLRTKESMDALVEAAGDVRPAVADRAATTLQRFTGKEIRDGASWKGWWAENRATFAFPEGDAAAPEAKEPKTVAYGLPLVSDHVAFLLDKSARMADVLQATKTSKDRAAHDELQRVLSGLHGRLVFQVYVYREEVEAFRKEPVALDPKEQEKALRFVARQGTKGAKDIWKALETVVGDPAIDTAYLLSSGEPDVGLYVHWNRVTRHLQDLNRFHKVVVHTVVYSESQWFRDQLEKIAAATGGRFQWLK
jgi:HEAT repeat protein